MDDEGRVDRVQAAWELHQVLSGGVPPDLARLQGLTAQELREAEFLFAASIEGSHDQRMRQVEMLAFLVEHAPAGLAIDEAIASLEPPWRAEFDRRFLDDTGDDPDGAA